MPFIMAAHLFHVGIYACLTIIPRRHERITEKGLATRPALNCYPANTHVVIIITAPAIMAFSEPFRRPNAINPTAKTNQQSAKTIVNPFSQK
jgi:hypothetical protein